MRVNGGHPDTELSRAMGAVARDLLGEPNESLSSNDELCFGSRGSLKVNLKGGTFYDFEAGVGGGTLDLVMRERHVDKEDAVAWLRENKHLASTSQPNIVARYPYTDADGRVLFEVVRLDPKDFRQRRPDPAGRDGWAWSMGNVQRVPYRLPEVLAAIAAGEPVLIAEGEKAVEALADLGFAATCSPGGAGKWKPEYGAWLNGVDVVILPDNDDPGRKHGRQVIRALADHARRVRVLELPDLAEKGDPFDWIAAGGTSEQLLRLIETAPSDLTAPPEIQIKTAPGWPEPLDFLAREDRPAPLLSEAHIPPALFPFVMDAADRMGVDPAGVALACIVACASVVTDDWRVQPKRFDTTWTEAPRLWGAIVGDPSILKSPVIATCTRPIDKLEADARRRHGNEMRSYKAQMKAAKADKTGETPDPPYPRQERFLIEGATVEAISEVLRDDESARFDAIAGKVLSRHDEMAEFFGGLDRYKAGGSGGSDRGAYLRLYNGGAYTVDRIQRGSFSIANWSACFLGGIQPGPIQRIAKDAADDGLLQRFIYVVPGEQRTGLDRTPDPAAQARYAALFPALVALQPPRTLDGEHDQVVAFHADAHQHREAVEAYAWAMAAMPDVSTRLKSAFGKWPGLFARIALTFHLIDVADARASNASAPIITIIPPETAERAADFMREIVLPHLLRADHLMFSSTQTGHAAWVAGFILSRGLAAITARDITRAYGALRSPEMQRELQQTMKHLVMVGWLEPEIPANIAKDVSTWTVNPAVHVLFADRGEREKQRRAEARENIRAHTEAVRNKARA